MSRLTRHEKPLPKTNEHEKNPNKIIVNQHVIPNKHILEWSVDGKMVEVFDIASNELKKLQAKSPYFCVMRLWDQWTETKMLKSNEDNYQCQIELMKSGKSFTNTDYIMAYYVLLCIRVLVANKERPHYQSEFLSISHESNQYELENNELGMDGPIHIINPTVDPNSQHFARQTVKTAMNKAFIQLTEKLKNVSWKTYNSIDENFILSDAFYNNFLKDFHVLPISPKKVLIAEQTHEYLIKHKLLSTKYINEQMKNNAINYYIILH